MYFIENALAKMLSADIGKLILRLSIGILMIFHGVKKALYGIDGIKGMLVNNGLPEFLAYGVYVGEIIAPFLIIIGLFTRLSSLIYAATMGFAIYLVHFTEILTINEKTGGLMIELPLLFMLASIALMFLGAGKFSVDRK